MIRKSVKRFSGVIFDWTGSYAAAFANGFAWNLLNVAIVAMLLMRGRQRLAMTQALSDAAIRLSRLRRRHRASL